MAANKGEWSEPYAAIRIMADGRIYLADNNGHRNLAEWMDVLSLQRIESIIFGSKRKDREVRYCVHADRDVVEIQIDGTYEKSIAVERFKHIAEVFKNDIIMGNSSSFDVSAETNAFLAEAEFNSLKAKSIDKSDVFVTIRDPRASIIREDVGFSIKSEFGKPPTIFNTARASAAKYKVSNMNDEFMDEINNLVDAKGNTAVSERCKKLLDSGCDLEFVGYPVTERAGCAPFYENLDNINPRLVDVIERIMWNHFFEGETARNIPDVVKVLIEQNPCGVTNPETKYPTMIKSFLYAGFCGMTASTIWNGDSQVKGGFISVNKEGEVVAHYAMESDSFKNYLYEKCFVDYPSTSPGHGDYANVYKEHGEYYFNLNFQIKMRKDD